MFSLLVLFQKTNSVQVNSTTTTETSQEKLVTILMSLADRVQDISTCQEPVDEFEQHMREITMELRGVGDADRKEFGKFLETVFNMRKGIKFSCVLLINFVRDLSSRISFIETFINKIPKYSEQEKKLARLLQITDYKLSLLASNSATSLEELKEELKGVSKYLLSIVSLSKHLRWKLKDLYNNGPPVELEYRRAATKLAPFLESFQAQYDFVDDSKYKIKVQKQLLSFKEAIDYSNKTEKSITGNKIQALDKELQIIKQEATNSNKGITNDQWNLVLGKLKQVREVLDNFLSAPVVEYEDGANKDKEKTDKNETNKDERDEAEITTKEAIPDDFSIEYYN